MCSASCIGPNGEFSVVWSDCRADEGDGRKQVKYSGLSAVGMGHGADSYFLGLTFGGRFAEAPKIVHEEGVPQGGNLKPETRSCLCFPSQVLSSKTLVSENGCFLIILMN